MGIVSFERGDEEKLTAHFARNEFECPCGCKTQMIDSELVEKLEALRVKLGKPIKVTSGYRCMTHNNKVGGSFMSKHRYGMAADWRMQDRSVNPVALGILAQNVGFGGVGIYWYGNTAFVHSDTRNGKTTWLCIKSGSYQYTSYNTFLLPTVELGDTGAVNKAAITLMQKLLSVDEDGVFGAKTKKALLKAQKNYGLVADGVCGPKSWKAISGADKYL